VDDRPSELIAVYLTRRETVRRFLLARTGNAQEADDLLQELYLKLERLDDTADVRDPLPYLFRMALNLARDRRRERQRTATRDAAWADTHNTLSGTDAVSDEPSVEAAYDAKQRLAAVRAAIEELSPQCRRVFALHKLDGRSHQEVADELGISRSAVEKHMHTAIKHLAVRLVRD
jgi:RNA polymerase sigma-70 factor (ECF subfamily)